MNNLPQRFTDDCESIMLAPDKLDGGDAEAERQRARLERRCARSCSIACERSQATQAKQS